MVVIHRKPYKVYKYIYRTKTIKLIHELSKNTDTKSIYKNKLHFYIVTTNN